MSRSCQNGHQQPCNITVIVVVNSKVHCRWNKDPLLQFYRQLHILSNNKVAEQTDLCQFDQCVSSVIQIWQHLQLASAHILLSTLTVPVNRGTHSPIRTHTPVIYSPNYYVPKFFSHQGHEHFKVFCQQNHLPLVCATCHRGQRWRQHSWTQGPSPPSSIPPHLLKHLKVPHSVLSYANLRVKQSILTKRLYATL